METPQGAGQTQGKGPPAGLAGARPTAPAAGWRAGRGPQQHLAAPARADAHTHARAEERQSRACRERPPASSQAF